MGSGLEIVTPTPSFISSAVCTLIWASWSNLSLRRFKYGLTFKAQFLNSYQSALSRTSSGSNDTLFHHLPFRLVSSFNVSGMVSSSKSNLTKTTVFWGWFFVLIGSVSFLGFLFTAVISKLLPASDNPLLSAIQKDRYYCFLVPLTMHVLVVAVYFHWLSMKLFKHA